MAETWRGLWVVSYRELVRYVRDRSRIVSSIAFPLLFLIIFGAGFSRVMGALAPGVDFVQFMYPGIIAMTVLTTSLFAGIGVVWDREFGFLKEILVAPLGRTGIVLGKATGATILAILQAGLILIIAPLAGVPLDLEILVALLPVIVVLAMGLSGLGILVASFMRSQQGFQLAIQLLIFPLIFLAGVFFPVNSVPIWLEVLVKLNPLTYGVDAIRQIFLGQEAAAAGLGVEVLGQTMTIAGDVLIVAVLSGIILTAAVWAFRRQE